MNPRSHFEKTILKVQIRRRVVNRIHPQHEEGVNLAPLHLSHQFLERFEGVHRVRFHRIRVVHGLADITQGVVHGVGQGVDGWRLLLAGNHEAGAAVLLEIANERGNPIAGTRPGAALPVLPAKAAAKARAKASTSLARKGKR